MVNEDGGTGSPQGTVNERVRLHEAQVGAHEKAGEMLVTLGRLLQGENVALTKQAKSDFIKIIHALSDNAEDQRDGGSEYFLPILVRAIRRIVVRNERKNRG
ncbi:uncharacterized protein [Dermacentor andersoni]|uniref:uncharacterized protein n=1 Tax=Dermacentor andersoni TaxID=34620 RepID=UPI002416FB48|nr:uncharacterized protein LOC126540487 [Dermacentor andersoni]